MERYKILENLLSFSNSGQGRCFDHNRTNNICVTLSLNPYIYLFTRYTRHVLHELFWLRMVQQIERTSMCSICRNCDTSRIGRLVAACRFSWLAVKSMAQERRKDVLSFIGNLVNRTSIIKPDSSSSFVSSWGTYYDFLVPQSPLETVFLSSSRVFKITYFFFLVLGNS